MPPKALFILLCIICFSCQQPKPKTSNNSKTNITDTYFPTDTTALWVTHGQKESDTVLIICQGGPSDSLGIIAKGKTPYRYIPGYGNYNIAYLHQAQTYDPAIFSKDLTLWEAEKAIEHTAEMLHRATVYFKNRDKTVVVIGNSFGAYIIPRTLTHFPALADRYVVLAGRLTDPDPIVKQHVKGFNGEYHEDGSTYVPEDEQADLSEYSASEIQTYSAKQLLKAAIGQIDYTQTLSDKDLSKWIYFYATNDTHVGRLSEAEIVFLETHGAQVYPTSDGHNEVLYRFIDRLEDGSIHLLP
jgi:pimeloyl-ACP methyl ester carboxylesterase